MKMEGKGPVKKLIIFVYNTTIIMKFLCDGCVVYT